MMAANQEKLMATNDARAVRKAQQDAKQNAGYDEAVRGGKPGDFDLDLRDEWLEKQDGSESDEDAVFDREARAAVRDVRRRER
jgi:hypothetical protein